MFAEDLAPFFSMSEFAKQATIGGQSVRVIFEQPYSAPFGSAVDAVQPTCVAASADIAALVPGMAIVIDGNAFTVERVEPDGTGVSRIVMYPTA